MKSAKELNEMASTVDTDTLTAAFLATNGLNIPEGYEVEDFRCPRRGDRILLADGSTLVMSADSDRYPRPILRKIPVKKWVVPTDEDAKQRPACRVRGAAGLPWRECPVLIRVNWRGFLVEDHEGHTNYWECCEIEKEVTE